MICNVLDNFFDSLYLHQLYSDIENIPVKADNIANRSTFPYGHKGSHKLFGTTLFDRVDMNRVRVLHSNVGPFFDIFDRVQRQLQIRFFLHSIHLNIQHSGCNGTTHMDSDWNDDYTILMMTNPEWNKEWGGQFQLTSLDGNEVIEEYDYVPGRIVILPSKHPHRGLGSTSPYIYRSSVVWRVTKFEDWMNRY